MDPEPDRQTPSGLRRGDGPGSSRSRPCRIGANRNRDCRSAGLTHRCDCGETGAHAYIIGDYSTAGTPDHWGRTVVNAYDQLSADRVAGERNYGGDMVEHTIRTVRSNISYKTVVATGGKPLEPNQYPHSTSRVGSTMSASTRNSKWNSPLGPRTRRGRRTVSTRWCGPSPNSG